MTSLPRAALLLALSALLAVPSCASGDERSGSGPGAATATTVTVPASRFVSKTGAADVEVPITDNDFNPPYVIVTKGTKVTWNNTGRNTHNVRPSISGAFSATDSVQPGAAYEVTFDRAGDFPYYCSIHGTARSGQNGVIRVVEP